MKIVVVEDHVMFRDAVCKACSQRGGHEIAAATGSGIEAVALVAKHLPDVLILDLSLPDMDGFTVAQRARQSVPWLRVVVFSAHLDAYTVYRVEQAGLHGFVDKNSATAAALRMALEMQAMGKVCFSRAFEAARRARQDNPESFDKVLSTVELSVLSLIAQGLSDAEISDRHGTSQCTAQAHRSHILKKLGIDGTPKLIAYATQHGFARFDPTPSRSHPPERVRSRASDGAGA